MYTVNHLPKQNAKAAPTGCCPKFEPDKWDGETFKFQDKLFACVSTRSFLHVPLNMGSVMRNAMAKIDSAGAKIDDEYIILSEDVTPWRADHFIAVSKPVPGLKSVELTGTFMARVFEGPYRDAPKWHEYLLNSLRSKNIKPHKVYFYYTTCPNCAKFYGKNYVVGLAQL